MNTAKDAETLKNYLVAQEKSRPDIVKTLAECCLGWPYVFGAAGEMCTPEIRRKYAGYHPEYKSNIYNACPVLSGKQATCAGCKWAGCRCFDCRGFTRWLLEQAGLSLAGGGATSQYETDSNWAAKGTIDQMPLNLVCCVFKRRDGKMSHTGMYMGNGQIIHCSTNVKTGSLNDKPAWTHYGIPAGLYTDKELKEAGVNVEDGRNIPTLRRGATGELVKQLQRVLNFVLDENLTVDGVFGAKTEEAVKEFQRKAGLTVDGVVGPKTWAELGVDAGVADPPLEYEPEPDEPEPDEDEDAGEKPPDMVSVPRYWLETIAGHLEDLARDIREELKEGGG